MNSQDKKGVPPLMLQDMRDLHEPVDEKKKNQRHARSHIHLPTNLSDAAADLITSFTGSWWFVAIHTVWFGLWILFQIESYPFGLLTLIVSLEAIFLSTFVMISQNRQSAKDHVRDDHEAREIDEIFASHALLLTLNQHQLAILELLRTLLEQQQKQAGKRKEEQEEEERVIS